MSRLPPSLPGGIEVIAHPDPLESVYHALLETAPRLIREHSPDIVVHVGLAPGQDYYSLEQGARRDGYHQSPDIARRVLTKAESRTAWGKKSADALETSFDLPRVLEGWRQRLRAAGGGNGKSKGGKGKPTCAAGGKTAYDVDVRHTDDVGNYVCGLLYYATLAELARSSPDGSRYVVFLHVPPPLGAGAEQDRDWGKGLAVLVALIESLADAWRQR